jgi:hypothetical protein
VTPSNLKDSMLDNTSMLGKFPRCPKYRHSLSS